MVTYNYTVGSLLHAAGRHRRHDHCYPCQSLQWCQCEDDHVIELRLVVAALNELPKGTYRHFRWQRRLVDFFNAKHKNHQCLRHNLHRQKTVAVDKWIRGERLSDNEMRWINEIRDIWRQSRDQLYGFAEFKESLTFDVLRMS